MRKILFDISYVLCSFASSHVDFLCLFMVCFMSVYVCLWYLLGIVVHTVL